MATLKVVFKAIDEISSKFDEMTQSGERALEAVENTGTAADGATALYDADLTGPTAIVIGNEGEGVGRLVKEKCDMVASIPMKGNIDSLNASVAAGVLAYEIVRQRLQ